TALELLAQVPSLDDLGHEARLLALAADVVHRDDVGVREGGSGPRFPLETGNPLRIEGEPLRKDLQGDRAAEARVPSAIDLAHPPRPQRSEDLVRPEPRARSHHAVR